LDSSNRVVCDAKLLLLLIDLLWALNLHIRCHDDEDHDDDDDVTALCLPAVVAGLRSLACVRNAVVAIVDTSDLCARADAEM